MDLKARRESLDCVAMPDSQVLKVLEALLALLVPLEKRVQRVQPVLLDLLAFQDPPATKAILDLWELEDPPVRLLLTG